MPRRNLRVLVTGGAGFIGSHIVERLVQQGREVVVIDDLSSGKFENLQLQRNHTIKFVKGDIRNQELVSEHLGNIEGVIHLAAIVNHEACLKNPSLANEVNSQGTLQMLEASRKHDVKRFVYASSAAVYGETKEVPVSENSATMPVSPYGASKLDGEKHCLDYQQTYGLRAICLRYFNVFGPRQSAGQYSGAITSFIRNLSTAKPPIIFGDGLQTRDFVNVADIADASILALENSSVVGTYNIGTGKETTVKAVAELLIEISGRTSIILEHAPARPGEIRRSVANIQKARSQLHFSPRTDLPTDLRELWNWNLHQARSGQLEKSQETNNR
jgi:UDP-glucose 4-epimerase